MLRKIAGVITGYAIFAVTAVILFQVAGQKPHAPASINFQLVAAIYGAVFSFAGGWILQVIAKTRKLSTNLVLAVIIAGFAAFSMIKTDGAHWTQLLAIFIFAPVSVLGGWFYQHKIR